MPEQNARNYPDYIFECILKNDLFNYIAVSLKFIFTGITDYKRLYNGLVWSGGKPSSESMLVGITTLYGVY